MLERLHKRGKNSDREDDGDEEKVKNRIDVFYKETVPIIGDIKKKYRVYTVPYYSLKSKLILLGGL